MTMNLTFLRNTIEVIDVELKKLRTAREAPTAVLEQLAEKYHQFYPDRNDDNPANVDISIRGCSSCSLEFRSFEDTYVKFGSDCNYCDPDVGVGLHVPNTWIESMLAQEVT